MTLTNRDDGDSPKEYSKKDSGNRFEEYSFGLKSNHGSASVNKRIHMPSLESFGKAFTF
jgi:hypothetical protein